MRVRRSSPTTARPPIDPLPDGRTVTVTRNLRDIDGERAVVMGPDIGIVRELVEHGCREVRKLDDDETPVRCGADIVIVSEATTVDGAIAAIGLARNGLSLSGRIVVRTMTDPSRLLCDTIARKLTQHGFSGVRVCRDADRVTFTAEIPAFGSAIRIAT
jgi:hypothetical protein